MENGLWMEVRQPREVSEQLPSEINSGIKDGPEGLAVRH